VHKDVRPFIETLKEEENFVVPGEHLAKVTLTTGREALI
jgi:hypothetical protein